MSWVSTDLFEQDVEIFSGPPSSLVQSSHLHLCCFHPRFKSSSSSVLSPSIPLLPPLPTPSSSLAPLPLAPFEPIAPSLHVHQLGLPWLLPPSAPPWTVVLMATPGSLIPPSALVSRRFVCAMDMRAFSCVLSLHPFGSVRLHLGYCTITSFALVLQHLGSTSAIRHQGSTSASRCRQVSVSPWIHLLAPPLVVRPLTPRWLLPPLVTPWAFVLSLLRVILCFFPPSSPP